MYYGVGYPRHRPGRSLGWTAGEDSACPFVKPDSKIIFMTDSGPRTGLILGGGGVVGVAWELGVLAAITIDAGWNPARATVITGTSAGSMAGALTALGRDLPAIVARRTAGLTLPDAAAAPPGDPATSAISPELLELMRPGTSTVTERARAVGRLARAAQPAMDAAAYRAFIGASVPAEWPAGDLRLTTVDCETGETVLLDRDSGLDLIGAVAASCAVPTHFPVVEHQGRHFTDGPRGPYIAALAAELGLEAIVFVGLRLPFMKGADEHAELDELAARGLPVARITDGPAFAAVGADLMDPAAAAVATLVGHHDGQAGAARVREALAAAAA
jgi:NTE family protein